MESAIRQTYSPSITSDLQPGLVGLSEAEAIARRERGEGNNIRIDTSRTYGQILRQNFFTFINIVLFSIGILMIFLGLWGDALVSVGVVMMNVVVGVIQEFRAKRKLDHIALLTRPQVSVIRDAQEKIIDPSMIVLGDLIVARAGDQIVVDGHVVGPGRMDVDESLLTGESDLIPKREGDPVFSGSFCVNGSAAYIAEKVGAESFANKLTISARQFRVELTPLQDDIKFIVRILLMLATIVGLLFGGAYAVRQVSTIQTVQSAAVIAGLVPAGLVLMTTTAYAMGALRMSGRGALIQQSNAVESMSNVNVLCLDKTGTLTANRIRLDDVHPFDEIDRDQFEYILGSYGRSTQAGNRTSEALAQACKGEAFALIDEIPFSSARKWSALIFDHAGLPGLYAIGAPEMLREYLTPDSQLPQHAINNMTERGLRVLLVAAAPQANGLHNEDEQPDLPRTLQPLGLVSFNDELRPEAKETLAAFIAAGIRPKIISGDNPDTVAALARQAGLPADIRVISGQDLSGMEPAQIDALVEEATVFGRITPEQKEMLVEALRRKGYYVAMIGDGVNDVLSLKKAQIGIAMQSGSAATRGVADIVLLNDSFAALPAAFMEGQRILNGMEDIIRLFLTRAFYVALIILGAAIVVEAQLFPFIPKHASLITLITVGIPAFLLAVWARAGVPKHKLTFSLMHFIIPASISLAAAALSVYTFYLVIHHVNLPATASQADELQAIAISRNALTTVTIFMGLLLLPFVEPPSRVWVGGDVLSGDKRPTIMALLLLLTYFGLILQPDLRAFFELEVLTLIDYLFLASVALIWALSLRQAWRFNIFERFLGLPHEHRVSD